MTAVLDSLTQKLRKKLNDISLAKLSFYYNMTEWLSCGTVGLGLVAFGRGLAKTSCLHAC